MSSRTCLAAVASGVLAMSSSSASARTEDGVLLVMHLVSPSATLTVDGKATPLPWMEITYIPVSVGPHRLEASGGSERPNSLDADLSLAASTPGRGRKPYWCLIISTDRIEPANPLKVVLMDKPTCANLLKTQGRD